MPNRFSALAQSMSPDIMGAIERGGALERQVQRERLADQELRGQLERQNRLRELAGQAYGAQSPTEREQFVTQAASVDPRAAAQMSQDLGSLEDRRRERLGMMATALTRLPQQHRPMLYQQMLPELRQLGLTVPEQYTDELDDLAQSLSAVVSGSEAPAQLRYFQAMTQGMEPEDVERARRVALGIEARPTSSGMSMQKIMGPDGREYAVVFDPRTGQPRPVSIEELFSEAPAPAAVPTPQPALAPTVAPPPAAPRTPMAGLTPAEKAEQEARARAGVDLEIKPQIEADISRAREQAKKEAAAGGAYRAVEYSLSETKKFIEQVERLKNHPGLRAATGFGGETLSKIPGTPAADAAAELDNLKNIAFIGALSAMRAASPTGGAVGNVSDAEGKRFENAFTALSQSQSYEQFVSNLDRLSEMLNASAERMREAYMRDYGHIEGAPRFDVDQGSPVRINSPQERDALAPGTQYIAPDGTVRTKR